MTYDALDNDIALLNVYFGESTAMGQYNTEGQHLMYSEYERTLKRTAIEIMVDMAAWFGELKCQMCPSVDLFSGVFLGISVLSLAEILFWLLKVFTGASFFIDPISAQELRTLKCGTLKLGIKCRGQRMVQEQKLDSSMFDVHC